MKFREAQLSDIRHIQVVRRLVKENRLSDPGLVTDEMCREFLFDRGKGWVCTKQDQLVGFSIVDLKQRNIWALFVHPDFDRQGIGRQLHDMMLDWYFDQTKDTVWLSTGIDTRAEEFYRRSGWKEVGNYGDDELKFEMSYYHWLERKSVEIISSRYDCAKYIKKKPTSPTVYSNLISPTFEIRFFWCY